MKISVLGCSGGIGGSHLRTTSLRVDDDVLIDCGTGVADLSMAELARIDHVFITHSHLDHIACLPLMIDTVGDLRQHPLQVYVEPATEAILRTHIFNWAIWPDFSTIPSAQAPWLRFVPIRRGETVHLGDRAITALPACHTVPAVGYWLNSGRHSLVFSGDTGPCPELWEQIKRIENLRTLIVETAFSNRERPLALSSRHLCPSLLLEELAHLDWADSPLRPDIFITHLKPGQVEVTMEELAACIGDYRPRMLKNNQVFEL